MNYLGDSITFGVGSSAPDRVYHAILKEKTGLAEVRNYGINGTRYALQHNRTTQTHDNNAFTERFESMLDDADAVVVFGGTNDYGHGDALIAHKLEKFLERL